MSRYLFKQVSHSDLIKTVFDNVADFDALVKIANCIYRSIGNHVEYNLVFVGPVGVGKSTICNMLYHMLDNSFETAPFNVYCYPEFLQINSALSHDMLARRLSSKLSAYEFQAYILRCWEEMMTNQPLEGPDSTTYKCKSLPHRINIFERCCDDSVICFSNIHNITSPKNISDYELTRLFETCRELDTKYYIPNYFDGKVEMSLVDSCAIPDLISQILTIMNIDMMNGVRTRFIGLRTDIDTLVNRIHSRNRGGESAYSYLDIKRFYNHYELLYHHIVNVNGMIKRYIDIAELVEDRKICRVVGDHLEIYDDNE